MNNFKKQLKSQAILINSKKRQSSLFIVFNLICFLTFLFIFNTLVFADSPVDISDSPLDSQLSSAPANIMLVIDDSGSMDWEILTSESDGLFDNDHRYVFDDTGDNLYTTSHYYLSGDSLQGMWKSQWHEYNVMYYNPNVTYTPWLDANGDPLTDADTTNPKSHPFFADTINLDAAYLSIGGLGEVIVDDGDSSDISKSVGHWGTWTSSSAWPFGASGQDYGTTANDAWFEWEPDIPATASYEVFNFLACWGSNMDPAAIYTITHAGGTDTRTLDQRSDCNAWVSLGTYTFNAGTSGNVRLTRSNGGTWTEADAVKFTPVGSSNDIVNAHYYVYSDTESKPYLINLNGSITYYAFNDADGDENVDSGELSVDVTPPADVVTDRTYAEERQNFANWFSYYRKRILASTAAISNIMPTLSGVKVGIRSINGVIMQPVLSIKVDGVDNTATILSLIQDFHMSDHVTGSTPLRRGLENVGRYFEVINGATGESDSAEAEFATSPIDLTGSGGCQQNFAIVFTDGAYNGVAPVYSTGDQIDPEGNTYPAPYYGAAQKSLADVSMHYYAYDLAPTVDNMVPTNFYDDATHQHMVTYVIGFGLQGTLNPDDYDIYNIDSGARVYPDWPSPLNTDAKLIDDLWHAAINGRGQYINAANPDELITAFEDTIGDIMARIGSGASVSINGEELNEGSMMYQSSYSTGGWTGDVVAYSLDATTGRVVTESPDWSASEQLDNLSWDTGRKIATYNGSSGVRFRYTTISAAQQAHLNNDTTILDFLRGDHTNEVSEGGTFRDRDLEEDGVFVRDTILGDIVHSSPLYFNDVLYTGANDGMMHAFDATDGTEIFAYVPNLVFENLEELSSTAYSHKYYVDLTPYAKTMGATTLLVGGLGAGGKGYYCLDITDLSDLPATTDAGSNGTAETALATKVKWEYPSTPGSDADMGYSFSQAYIINTNAGWVVIFGNGYNSDNGIAMLYVLNSTTGALLAKVTTGAGGSCDGTGTCNGLSTPAPIDINGDSVVDYVFAGDLLGNMWKFDLTDSSVSNWDVAYKDGATPKPLFQAKDASGNVQPITTKPDAMLHCDITKPGGIIVFGTGKYLGTSDLADTNVQTIYGIWDYGDDADNTEYLGSFNRGSTPELSNQAAGPVTLLEQTEIYYGSYGGNTLRVLSDNTPVWETVEDINGVGDSCDISNAEANNAGWYFDLPTSKERVIQNPILRDGKAIVITSTPTSSPCSAGGTSIMHEINSCTGGRLVEAQFDINGDDVIDENDLIEITDPDDPTATILVPPTGLYFTSMIYPPQILRAPDGTEIKYFSTSAAMIVTARETSETRGIYFWKELNE